MTAPGSNAAKTGLRVIAPGLCSTVQDAGRVGYRAFGVPVGGPFDRSSARLANALVGNAPDAAVLELTVVGGTYRAEGGPLALAIAGAPFLGTIRDRDGNDRPVPSPGSWTLRTGETLMIGGTPIGARAALAVRGGWCTDCILGSRASETPFREGDFLPAAPGQIATRRPNARRLRIPTMGLGLRPIHVLAGPDVTGIEGGVNALRDRRFIVGPEADRMGIRLQGETPRWVGEPLGDRASAPIAPGAIQLAGDRLIVLGPAAGTMGGYPHVAHVLETDMDRLGQARPGEPVRFRPVSLDRARRVDRSVCRRQDRLYGWLATASGG